MKCLLCLTKGRTREVPDGHVCPACTNALTVDLGQIVDLVAIASTFPEPMASRPTGEFARPVPGSRPPLDVARIDPELVMVKIEGASPSSAWTVQNADGEGADDEHPSLLVVLESWERLIREERGFAPYGDVSTRRLAQAHDVEGSAAWVTLSGVVGFLRQQVPWMVTHPEDFPIEQFAGEVGAAMGTLRSMDPTRERANVWRVPCPGDIDEQDEACGRLLSVAYGTSMRDDLTCPRCGHLWTPQRLLLVALSDPRVSVWAYPDVIVEALAVNARTLRDWGQRGVIGRRGSLYDAGGAFRQQHSKEAAG